MESTMTPEKCLTKVSKELPTHSMNLFFFLKSKRHRPAKVFFLSKIWQKLLHFESPFYLFKKRKDKALPSLILPWVLLGLVELIARFVLEAAFEA